MQSRDVSNLLSMKSPLKTSEMISLRAGVALPCVAGDQHLRAGGPAATPQSLANSLNTVLWNSSYQVYAFNTGSATVNPTWCGWASEALIRLYQADGNTTWLSYAQENIDFMNTYLRNASTYGYYSSSNIDGSDASSTYQGVDQAWMQKIQALMALYK
jgi:hypothetical protein